MNLFNRILAVFLFMALVAGAVAVIVLAWTIPNRSIDALSDAVQYLSDNNEDVPKTILTLVAGAIGFGSLVFLIFELMPKVGTDVKVTDLQAGDAVLSTAAISQRIEEAVIQVPHVSEVRTSVRARRKGVQVSLDLHVDPDANLAVVTDEACRTAADVLTQRVHVALAGPPKARLHYRELRLRRATAANRAGQAFEAQAAVVVTDPDPSSSEGAALVNDKPIEAIVEPSSAQVATAEQDSVVTEGAAMIEAPATESAAGAPTSSGAPSATATLDPPEEQRRDGERRDESA